MGIGTLASAGVVITNPGTFSSGMSLQLCENVNLLKEILREASQPDKILCYMGAMKASGVIPGNVNLSDGETKYVRLTNLPAESQSFRIKKTSRENSQPIVRFRIQKTNGVVTSFKMHSCFDGTPSSPTQSEYISQVFSGGIATVTSKYIGSESTQSYGSEMTATGNFSNAWDSKNISGQRFFSDGGQSNKMTINMDQFSNQIEMSIAMQGVFGSDSFTNLFFTVAQLIGTSPSTFAIGDGSSKVDMSFDQGNNGSIQHSDTATYSWNGDTRMNITPASNGTYFTSAATGSVPAAPGAPSAITFTGDEAWDCTVPSGATVIDANFSVGGLAIVNGMNTCNDKYGEGGSWISCPY
ncbi:MAG: hypothetical protein K2Q26_10635 [Bdellovibrionales bacterium]|nr:hypothetical protein [Bdellovibrionales bacterium]